MQKVISGEELKNVMQEAVNMLCDTVSSTLGPTGNNILINNSETTPYITNDGVTIASNIECEDERVNTILEILKEASLKTNELVGDGTTTTLVLLQSIFNLGLEEINKGKNKILLKNELLNCMDEIVDKINKLKKETREKDYLSIATTSSNDYEIGKMTTEVFLNMKTKYSIKLEESNNETTYSINKKGYNIPINSLSSMYFSKSKEIELNNVYILILKGYLDSLESISDIINDVLKNNRNILILTEGMNDDVKNEALVYYFNNQNIYVAEIEEYASHRDKIEDDISTLSNCTIKNIDYEEASFNNLGTIDKVILNNNEVTLINNSESNMELIQNLKEELKQCKSDYDREFINSRLAKLENGITTIYVGGTTKSEKREKLMRYEDALCALETAKNGVVLGEGITYLKVAKEFESDNTGSLIVKKSLEKPFEKVIENLGLNYKEIKNNIINRNYEVIYDYEKDNYISINDNNIIDPVDVIICAFKNALSIAAILLSTSSLIINTKKESNKEIYS